MYAVYFLQSKKDWGFYIGLTKNISRRIHEHNAGMVRSTKGRRPLVLLGYEECKTIEEGVKLEKEWKKGYKREELKRKFNL